MFDVDSQTACLFEEYVRGSYSLDSAWCLKLCQAKRVINLYVFPYSSRYLSVVFQNHQVLVSFLLESCVRVGRGFPAALVRRSWN